MNKTGSTSSITQNGTNRVDIRRRISEGPAAVRHGKLYGDELSVTSRSLFNTDIRRNPWATYPGIYPPDTSAMYTGNSSSYNPSSIHLMYLTSRLGYYCAGKSNRGVELDVNSIVDAGKRAVESNTQAERESAIRGLFISANDASPEGRHQITGRSSKRTLNEYQEQQRSYLLEFISKQYKKKYV